MTPGQEFYSASDVVASLMSGLPVESEVDSSMLTTA
jgi:hypothetical protein